MPLNDYKITVFTSDVSDLDDDPILSAADLKTAFDAAPNELRENNNDMIDFLQGSTDGDSGADNIGSTPLYTGGPATTQANLEYLYERANASQPTLGVVSVSDYGAVGDGVTNDTVAFQNAVNAAISANKKEVYCVGGKTYLVNTLTGTSGITFLGDNVTITGTSGISVIRLSSRLVKNVYFEKIDIKDYGAVGDNSTDDTDAIEAAIADMDDNCVLIIPQGGIFKITNVLTISGLTGIKVVCDGEIRAHGCGGILIDSCAKSDIEIRVKSQDAIDEILSTGGDLSTTWGLGLYGFQLKDSNTCTLHVRSYGFTYGYYILGSTAGCSYCKTYFDEILNNKYGVYALSEDTGYVTQHEFYSGRFGLDSNVLSANTGDYGMYFNRANSNGINNISIYSPCFEGLHNAIRAYCSEVLLANPRFENVTTWMTYVLVRSTWIAGNGGFDPSKIQLDEQSRNNTFIGKHGTSEVCSLVNAEYGGFGFINFRGDFALLSQIKYALSSSCIKTYDPDGRAQSLNKCYESASLPPTSGTYNAGAVVWNTNRAPGQVMYTVAAGAGTQGTLSGVTGSGTSGEYTITVNDADDLHVGDYILITGVTGSKQIGAINGLVVTLTATINATVTDAAVAYKPVASWVNSPVYS